MGVVWLARDEDLERDVALKFLPEVVAMDRQAVQDLKRETRRSLELTHPHIIRIYDFVQDVRAAAISMEYVAGDTLAGRKLDQAGGFFEPKHIEGWVRELCEALAYAHERAQVVHRDLKPANLMIDARGELKIADFGIAASVSDSVSRVSVQASSSGTPVYMSPQQMMGEKPAVSDDIYSLGATLYDLLTSRPPFHGGNIIAQVQGKVPASLAARR
jgi:serine/threonine protein kinase